jgi:Tol biopolymer transport system component
MGSPGLVQTLGPGLEKTAAMGEAGDPFLVGAWPAISPDGKTMAASLLRVGVSDGGWRPSRPLDAALGVSDLFGAGLTILGAGTDPAWSPHGRRIAFARTTDGHPHLFVSNADGSGATQITEGPDDDERPSWSPDGRVIVFCSAHATEKGERQANLFVVRPDGSELVQLTEGDRDACRPAWGRDGFIYFHANATDRFHIWRLRPRLDPGL